MKNIDIYDNIISESGDFQLGYATDQYGSEAGIQERNISVRNNLISGPQNGATKWESPMKPFNGVNTIVGDPMFTDPTNGDLTLKEGSPAKGAASTGGNIGAF